MIDLKIHLLLTAAAVACLACPPAGLADPPSKDAHALDQGKRGQGDGGQGKGGQPKQQGPAPTAARLAGGGPGSGRNLATNRAPAAAQAVQTQQVQRGGGQRGAQNQPAVQAAAPTARFTPNRAGTAPASRPVAQSPRPAAPNVQAQQVQRPAGRQFQTRSGPAVQSPRPGVQAVRQAPPAPPPLGGWNRSVQGPQRLQAGQQWRQTYSGWDNNALWRRDANWWRNDIGFQLFHGVRVGFFFVPEMGYVSAPAEYRDHAWRPGDYLPNWFWQFEVRDYERFGLPRPPDGCVWVWVNNDVALIDPYDGYILDIALNVW